MAKLCINCKEKIGWGDSVKLLDGYVCIPCYHKSGKYVISQAEHISSEDMIRMIQKLEPLNVVARRSIKDHWESAVSQHGWNEENAMNLEDICVWTHDGRIYECIPYETYQRKYGFRIAGCNTELKFSKLISELDPVECTAISIDNIQYFAKEGDVQYTTRIIGGGGGGSSLSGAILGGIVAGDAGAIIGSRKKIESIESKTEKHDNRRTILRYYEGDTIRVKYYDGFEMYDCFLQLMPEKDLLTIQIKSNNINSSSTPLSEKAIDSKLLRERLVALKSMYEDGLIDQDDYRKKKQDLLNQY